MLAIRRVIAALLIGVQCTLGMPVDLLAQGAQEVVRDALKPTVKVNRTVPVVSEAPSRPVFSSVPTDGEILAARIFPEPLVRVGASSPDENVALVAALNVYVDGRDPANLSAIHRFMESHPTSGWQPSLLLNASLVLLKNGFVTRAIHGFESAWNLTKSDVSPAGRGVADTAIGELVRLEARLGHDERVEALLADVDGRTVRGPATERIADARQGLEVMRRMPAEAFRCGPFALAQTIEAFRPGTPGMTKLQMTRTGPKGSSVAQLLTWASGAGVDVRAVRHLGSDYPVPSVLHLKTGHYTALIQRDGDRYLVSDPAFGGQAWVRGQALAEEGSGVLVVPAALAPAGAAMLSADEAANVWGRGLTSGPEDRGPTDGDGQTPRTCPPSSCFGGMFAYSIHLMMVSLHLEDTPLAYAPPVGPPVSLTIEYNQRESHQPTTFTYTNLGPKWTLRWLSYVVDDPTTPSAPSSVGLFRPGGGQDPFRGVNGGTGAVGQDTRTRTTLKRVASNPIRYERYHPDGSIDVFAKSDGAVGSSRRVFMTEQIDPQGNKLTFTHDSQLRLIAVTDAIGLVTRLDYERPGDIWKLTKVTDPFGRSATFTYDALGHLATSTDVLGLISSVRYSGDDVTSMTTPYGRTQFVTSTSTAFSGSRIVEATDPLGGKERVEFRSQWIPSDGDTEAGTAAAAPEVPGVVFNNPIYLRFRNTLYWDKAAMAVAGNPPDANAAHIYHWLHQKEDGSKLSSVLESEKPALGRRIYYAYPGQLPDRAGWEGEGRLPSTVARVLQDAAGSDPLVTQAWRAEYNDLGHPTILTDPLDRQTTLTYASNDIDLTQVKQTTGSVNDVLATSTYDAHHRPLTITDAAGKTTTLTYNGRGQLLTATDTLGRTYAVAYDGDGYPQSVTGPVTGSTSTLGYDAYRRVSTATTPEGYVVTSLYDRADRPTSITFPDGTTQTFTYDRLDLVQAKDRANRRSITSYDALRRPVASGDSLGRITRQTWSTGGTLSSVTDAKGGATSWDYDLIGRVTKETRPGGGFTTYVYDPMNGRLQSVTDPKLQVATYTYTIDGSVTSVAYSNATIPTPTVTMTYDPNYQRLATMTDGIGTTTYAYVSPGTQGAGQAVSIDGPLTNDTFTYTYDELGRRKTRMLNGVTTTWNYDTLGRMQSVVDSIVGTFTYAYDGASGRLQQLEYPNHQTSTYNYFGNADDRRLQEIHHQTSGGATLSRFTYAYDRPGNIKTWTQQYGTDVKAYDFTYDAADQLTGAVYRTTDATPTILKRYGYAYDTAGNRTMARVDDAPTTFTYNNLNQLTSQVGGGVVAFSGTTNEAAAVTIAGTPATGGSTTFSGSVALPAGTSTVAVTATDASGNTAARSYEVDVPASTSSSSYDANGNLIAQGTRTYEWDATDQLVRVLDAGSEIARFVYDGHGRRVEKTTSGTTRQYVYSGSNILEERSSSGTIRTVQGPGVDRPLASVDGGGTVSYYLADHLGSIVQQTDASAAVTMTRRYDPYGVPLQGAGTPGYAFTGREWDAEIGLYYYRARYYDPACGRFLSADPIGLAGGPNLYAYVDGNPVNRLDPSGLGWADVRAGAWDAAKCIVAGVAAAATVVALGAAGVVSAPAVASAAVVVGTAGLLIGIGVALYEGYQYYNGTLTVEEADYAAGGAVVAFVAMLVGGVAWSRSRTTSGAACRALTKAERLDTVFQRVDSARAATTAEEAMQQMHATLNAVEDAFSGVPKNLNPGLKPDGRMYPVQPDRIVTGADGTITATSRGHVTAYGPNGSITVRDRATGAVVFYKAGGG